MKRRILIILVLLSSSYCLKAQKDSTKKNDTSAVKQKGNNRGEPNEKLNPNDTVKPGAIINRKKNKGDSIPLP